MGEVVQFPGTHEAWITKKQLCAHYGGRSRRTIERWVRAGCPHRKLGTSILFRISDVDRWLDEQEAS